MSLQDFLSALETLTGFAPDMLKHLRGLAPKMTDDQRKRTIGKLLPIHAEVVEKQEAIVAKADQGMKALQAIKKTKLPKMRADVEKTEKSDAENILTDIDNQ